VAGKGKPGPAKGKGGRPRKKSGTSHSEGYIRVTVGPPGEGRQEYKHRVEAGSKKGDGKVVDHQDGNKKNNSKGNLKKMSRAENTRKAQKKGGK
jgi:hypothetical protein